MRQADTCAMTYYYNSANGSKTKIINFSDYARLNFTLTEKLDNSSITITKVVRNAVEFKIVNSGIYTHTAAYKTVWSISRDDNCYSRAIHYWCYSICSISRVSNCRLITIIMTTVNRKKNKAQLKNQ